MSNLKQYDSNNKEKSKMTQSLSKSNLGFRSNRATETPSGMRPKTS